jgi:TonB family protein
MGFSQSVFEQYTREIRILRWVLAVGALAAAGFHLFSVPAIIRYAGGLMEPVPTIELETTPVEIVVVDEPVTPEPEEVTPPPPTETAETNEPGAGAEEPSPLPLASDPVVPEPASAESMDTVAIGPAIASETGAEDGAGAVGEADTVGILPGSGSPEGDPTAPVTPPPVRTEPPVERQPVQEVARARAPSARTVACDPCTQPDYPLTERRDRIEGQPVINVIFDQNGNVVTAEIEKSSGNAAFDQAALEEARRNWRFRDPYGLGGQVSVEVTFVIEGSEQHDAAQSAGRQETIELPVQQSITPVAPTSAGSPSDVPAEPAAEPTGESVTPSSPAAPEPTENPDVGSEEPSEPESAAPIETPEEVDEPESPETPSVTPDPDITDSGAEEIPTPTPPESPSNPPSDSTDSSEPAPAEPSDPNSGEEESNGEVPPVVTPPPNPTSPPPAVEIKPTAPSPQAPIPAPSAD